MEHRSALESCSELTLLALPLLFALEPVVVLALTTIAHNTLLFAMGLEYLTATCLGRNGHFHVVRS